MVVVAVSTDHSQGSPCLDPQLTILALLRSHAIYPNRGQGPVLPSSSLSPESVQMGPEHTAASETELHPHPRWVWYLKPKLLWHLHRVESHQLPKDTRVHPGNSVTAFHPIHFPSQCPDCSSSSKTGHRFSSLVSPKGETRDRDLAGTQQCAHHSKVSSQTPVEKRQLSPCWGHNGYLAICCKNLSACLLFCVQIFKLHPSCIYGEDKRTNGGTALRAQDVSVL